VFLLVGTGVYFSYFNTPPSCFDGKQNGDERGVDCGGSCARVCPFDVDEPRALWARSFEIVQGQYNAVAYIENTNQYVGAPELSYTFKLYDENGLIIERRGVTTLPPDSVYPVFEGRINTGTRVPTQTIIEFDNPDLWLPATGGREQFTVANRTLKGADSAPRLTADITNTALTSLNDVEIVATIFDTSGNALTASQTLVERFGSRTTESVTFTWPMPIAGTLRSCEIPTDVVVAIDLSGSMNDDGGTPPEPITSVLQGAQSFVDRLGTKDQVGVVSYATNAVVEQSLTTNIATVRSIIGSLSIAPKEETGSTNTGEALQKAMEVLDSAAHNVNARKVAVLLTDGLATAPKENPEEYAYSAAEALKETGATVFTIGLGDSVNESFLKTIASSESGYFKAVSAGTVDRIYRSVTSAICEDGPAIIDIIPKTRANFVPLQ